MAVDQERAPKCTAEPDREQLEKKRKRTIRQRTIRKRMTATST